MSEFIDSIKNQASKCKLGLFEIEACEGQLVLGATDMALRKTLLIDDSCLTFEKALILRFDLKILEQKKSC